MDGFVKHMKLTLEVRKSRRKFPQKTKEIQKTPEEKCIPTLNDVIKKCMLLKKINAC